MSLPNILTIFRLCCALFLALPFLLLPLSQAAWIGFMLFALASITDFFDGYLARKWNQVSELGRMLDPIADKVLVLMVLPIITAVSGFEILVFIPIAIIIFREVLVSGMREFLGDRAKALKVTKLAKWKTTAQMFAIGVILLSLGAGLRYGLMLGMILLWIAAILTLITGADYARKAVGLLND